MKKYPKHELRHSFKYLWEAESLQEILDLMNSWSRTYPNLKSWFNHKKQDWILAGLIPEKSKILIDWWRFAYKHTNISESSHFSDNNYTRQKLSLLATII